MAAPGDEEHVRWLGTGARAGGFPDGLRRRRDKLLEILCRWLEAQDLAEKDLDRIVEGQPLRLQLLRRLLEAAGDPD